MSAAEGMQLSSVAQLTRSGAGAPGLLTREAWDVLTTAPNAVYVRTAEVRLTAACSLCACGVGISCNR